MSGTVGPRLSTIIPTFLNNYSFEFDGTDDKVITSSAIVGSDITLSGWYNLNAASYTAWQYQFATCIAPSNSSASNAALGKFYKRGSQMEIGVQAYDQNSANYSTYAVRVQLEGAGWNHVVWTYNDTTKHIYCYLNGVAQTWTNYGGTITTPYLTGNPTHLYGSNLIMGAISPTSTTGFFSGLLDEVSTYDRILTPSEITGIYNGGSPNDLTSLSPYGWWRNGDNGTFKSAQWLIPNNENKDKISNYSMSFDGTDDYIDCGDLNSLVANKSKLSISFWVNVPIASELNRITGKNSIPATTTKWLEISATEDKISMVVAGSGLNESVAQGLTGVVLSDNTWHHVVGVFDGTQSVNNDRVKIYVDNVDQVLTYNKSFPSETYDFTLEATTTPWYIGQTGLQLGLNELRGQLNDYAIYSDVALTATMVGEIFNEGTPKDLTTLPTTPSPELWYRMGENATFKDPQWLIANNENKDKVSNYSMSFDGTDDVLTLSSAMATSGTDWSVSFWIKTIQTGGNKTILSTTGGGTGSSRYISLNWNKLTFFSSDNSFDITSVLSVNDGVWHNIVFTYNYTSGAWILYIDGALDTSQTATTGIDIPNWNSFASRLGSAFYSGNLDECAYFNSVVNVATIYNSGTPTTITGAVAHWKMGDDATFSTNWTVPDQIGSNDGTSANMGINDRLGESPGSSGNALSYNMVLSGRTSDVPT